MVRLNRKLKKEKLGKITLEDIERISRLISREIFGIIPSKKHKNKKKYTRKLKHKSRVIE